MKPVSYGGYHPSAPSLHQIQAAEAAAEAAKRAQEAAKRDAEAQKRYADRNKMPDLDEECPECLETFSTKPAGDPNIGVVLLARTECGHFAHEFCLKKWLKQQRDKLQDETCMSCRTLVYADKIDLIPLESKPVVPKATNDTIPVAVPAPKQQPTVQPKPVQTTKPAEEPANGPGAVATALNVAGFMANGVAVFGKWAWNKAMNEKPRVTMERLKNLDSRLIQMDKICNEMSEKLFKKAKKLMAEKIVTLNATTKSLLDIYKKKQYTEKEHLEYSDRSKKIEKDIETLEKYSDNFDDAIAKAHEELSKNLEQFLKN